MIDTYFKQYFWTFHLLVIGLAGILVAKIVGSVVGESFRLPPGSTGMVATAVNQEEKSAKDSPFPVSAFLDKNVFRAQREDLEAEERRLKELEDATQADDGGEIDLSNCSKSSMSKNLVATVVTSVEARSVAVFAASGKEGETEAFYVGDKLDAATIRAIEWRRVLIDNGGKCEFFSMETEDPTMTARASAPAPLAQAKDDGKPGDLDLNVQKTGDNDYSIPRGDIDGVLSNLSVVATQARIVPSFQNGKPNGFKLFSIRPGSLYSKIGIQNGDVIQKINGYEINSPDKAFEIYSKLKDTPSITVDLVRRGRSQTMTYNIR